MEENRATKSDEQESSCKSVFDSASLVVVGYLSIA